MLPESYSPGTGSPDVHVNRIAAACSAGARLATLQMRFLAIVVAGIALSLTANAQSPASSPRLLIPSGHAPGIGNGVTAVGANPQSGWFATLGADQTLCIWSVEDGHFLGKTPAAQATAIAVIPQSHLAIEGDSGGTLSLMDVDTFALVRSAKLPGPVRWLQSTRDGRVFAVAPHGLYRLDPSELTPVQLSTLPAGMGTIYAAMDSAGAALAVAMPGLNDDPGPVLVYDTRDGRLLRQTEIPHIVSVALDGGLVAIGTKDSNNVTSFSGHVRILRVADGTSEHDIALTQVPWSLSFTREAQSASTPASLIAGHSGRMERISMKDGKVTSTSAVNEVVAQLAWAGPRLISAGTATAPRLCDPDALRCTLPPAIHGVAVTQAKLLPDGSLLLMDHNGNSLRLADDIEINKVLLFPAMALISQFRGVSGVFATDGGWVNNALVPVTPGDTIRATVAGTPVGISDDGRYLALRANSPEGRDAAIRILDISRLGKNAADAAPVAGSWMLTSELPTGADAAQEFQFRFVPDGRMLVAIDTESGSVHRFDVQASKEALPALNPAGPQDPNVLGANIVSAWAISADGRAVVRAQYHSLRSIPLDGAAAAAVPLDGNARALTAGKDGAWYIAMEDGRLLRWDGQGTPMLLAKLPYPCNSLLFIPERNWIVANLADGTTRFIDAATGQAQMSLLVFDNGRDWFLWTASGLFDSSDGGWQAMQWKFASGTFSPSEPVEDFRDDFYFPGLAAQVIAGSPPSAPSLRERERRTPSVQISVSNPSANGTVALDVTVSAPAGVAIRDVHVARNGVLLKTWSDEQRSGNHLQLAAQAVAGENRFTAFAFNQDDVKSKDAEADVAAPQSLKRAGELYVVAIGIDDYRNSAFHLNYARKDAQLAAGALAEQRKDIESSGKQYVAMGITEKATGKVMIPTLNGPAIDLLPSMGDAHLTLLLDQDATRDRILDAIRTGSRQARPEDMFVLFYAGHGVASGDRYYLLPQDFAFDGKPQDLLNASPSVLERSAISDLDLRSALSAEHAAVSVLILDSCQSGQLVGDRLAQRRGPMNSRGLAQMAYDKGMFILAAALSTQSAEEQAALGDGVLTYALMQEGLIEDRASPETVPGLTAGSHGPATLAKWLSWSVQRVASGIDRDGRPRGFPPREPGKKPAVSAQQPRLFSPPGEGGDTIVALRSINFDPQTMNSAGFDASLASGENAKAAVAPAGKPAADWLFPLSTLGAVVPGAVIDGGHQMLATLGNRVAALDLDHGAAVWERSATGTVIGFDVSAAGEMVALDQTGNVARLSESAPPKILVHGFGFSMNGLVRWIDRDRQLLVVTDNSIAIYQADGRKVASANLPFMGVHGPVLTASGDRLYVGDALGSVYSYQVPSLSAGPSFIQKSQTPAKPGHFTYSSSLVVDPGAHRLIRVMSDGAVAELDLPSLSEAPKPLIHADGVRAAVFNADGAQLFVADSHGSVQAIRTADEAVVHTWPANLHAISSLALDRSDTTLVAIGNGGLEAWSLPDGTRRSLVPGGPYVTTASFTSAGSSQVMLYGNNRLRSFQFPVVAENGADMPAPPAVFISHNRVVGRTANGLELWDGSDASKSTTIPLTGDGTLDLTADGRTLAWMPAGFPSTEIRILEAATHNVLKRIPLAAPVNAFTLAPNGQLLVYLSGEQLHLVPMDGKPETSLNLTQPPCCFVSISPANDRLLLASPNAGIVMLFDLASQRVLRSIETSYPIILAQIGPHANQAVLASSDGVVLLWDSSQTQESVVLGNVKGVPLGISFNPAGTLASVSTDQGNIGWFSLSPGRGRVAVTSWVESTQSWFTQNSDGLIEVDGNVKMPVAKTEGSAITWAPADQTREFTPNLLKDMLSQ